MSLHFVVLAGGSGTRLWPASRRARPKHLLPLGPGGGSLLRATVERLLPLGGRVHVVTEAGQVEACRKALAGLPVGDDAMVAEPEARGTGPALCLAVRTIAREDPEALVCSVHADHYVGDDEAYRTALWAAAGWAASTGRLAMVGLVPRRPATGFGYIALGEALDTCLWSSPGAGGSSMDHRAARLTARTALGFVEKPDLDTARRFVDQGRHLWNLGLFAWPVAVFEEELQRLAPEVAGEVAAVVVAQARGDEAEARTRYGRLRPAAIEPLLLERSSRLVAVEASFPWSDLGSWRDLAEVRRAQGRSDAAGNVTSGDAVVVDSSDCLVEAEGGRLVALVGGQGLVVVDSGDAVLVVAAERAQEVREVVDRLRAHGRDDLV